MSKLKDALGSKSFVKIFSWFIQSVKIEILTWLEFFVVYAPNEKIGQTLRKIYWKTFYKIGSNPVICRGTILTNPGALEIGDNVSIGEDVAIYVGPCKGVYIGNYVGIGRGTFIRSANHKFDSVDKPYLLQGHDCKSVQHNGREYSIVIEDDIFIGAHSVILSGAKIGHGCVIAAGSVLSGTYPPYSIIAGNPARVISNRKKKTGEHARLTTNG